MYQCPSCETGTIRFVRKWLSSRSFPVRCTSCGTLSYAPGSAGGIVMVLNTVAFTLAGFAGVYFQSLVPVGLAVALAVALWFYRLHLQPLFALSPEQAAKARKVNALNILAVIIFLPLQ